MFIIDFKPPTSQPIFSTDNCLIKFLSEDKVSKELSRFETEFKILIPEIQKKNILSRHVSEIKIYSDSERTPAMAVIVKLVTGKDFNNDYFRNYFAGFLPSLENQNVKVLQIIVPDFADVREFFPNEAYLIQSIAEGIVLGNYSFDKYKSEKKEEKKLSVILSGNKKVISEVLGKTRYLMEGVLFARDLANEPSNVLYPAELAERCQNQLSKVGIKVKILDEKEITSGKFGGIIAIGKGSDKPPRLIFCHYKPKGKSRKKVALVGKGVTFDSGGISIKPAAGMGEMKADMGGAAAVIGTLLAAAKADLPVEIFGIIPAVENMPSGKACKPGDIVRTSSGKSIEIDNTDAEGRIILADALEFAISQKPDVIIDLATLTGACVVALGEYTAGMFTQDDKLADELYRAGLVTFERLWRLPLWNEYKNLIKSDVADVKNTGGKWGGAISAAKFLENFVDTTIPWAHLDIAGPAINNDLNNYTKKFMTGFGVRFLFEYLSNQ